MTAPRLPRGRHGLSPTFVARNQRERLLAAVADASLAKGYHAMTVEDIVRGAACSRRTFYDNFAGKPDAFLAALDAVSDQCRAAVGQAMLQVRGWRAQTRCGLDTLLRFTAANPSFAHMAYVDIPKVGPVGLQRYDAAVRTFEVFLAGAIERAPAPVPPRLGRMIGGAISELMRECIVRGACEELPGLLPDVLYLCFLPFVGRAEAAREAGLG